MTKEDTTKIVVLNKDESVVQITLKEVYERVVALETRLDQLRDYNRRNTSLFKWLVAVIVVLQLTNIVFSYVINLNHLALLK